MKANLTERVTFAEASMKAMQSKTLCWKDKALNAVVRTWFLLSLVGGF